MPRAVISRFFGQQPVRRSRTETGQHGTAGGPSRDERRPGLGEPVGRFDSDPNVMVRQGLL
jgi:hypothetical protein